MKICYHLEVVVEQRPGLWVPDLLGVLHPLAVLVAEVGGDEQPVPAKLQVVSAAVRVHEACQAQALEEHGEAQRLRVQMQLQVTRELARVDGGVEHKDAGVVEVEGLLAPIPARGLEIVQGVGIGRKL